MQGRQDAEKVEIDASERAERGEETSEEHWMKMGDKKHIPGAG